MRNNYEAVSKELNELVDSLSRSEIYKWTWNVKEGFIKMRFPTLHNEGHGTSDTVTLDKFLDIIYADDLTKIHNFSREDSKDKSYVSVLLRLKQIDGEYKWYELRGKVVVRDRLVVEIIEGVAIDCNDTIEVNRTLLESKQAELESEKVKTSFLTGVTHELRTPLQSVVGFSEILTTIDDVEEKQKCFDVIRKNNDLLVELLGTVAESDTEPTVDILNEVNFCIWEYMVELQQVYAMKIQGPVRLVFTNKYDDTHVFVDKDKLGRIFDTLLTNSINNTMSGYISYGYEIKNKRLSIIINDTGAGFSKDAINNMFNLSGGIEEDGYDSYTLSLSICRSLIRKMNGEITVNSTPGAGSSFVIELPLKKGESAISPEEKEIQAMEAMDKYIVVDANLPTILIAEDVMYSYMMMKTVLEDRFNVIHAADGLEAIDMYKTYKPVFIFMDIKMPQMDGLEATRQIRQLSADVPIIILTAYAVRSLKKEASDAGCTDILTKPTTSKQINATIKKYLK